MSNASNARQKLTDLETRLATLVDDNDIIWGAAQIGAVLKLSARDTQYLLATGKIPGVRKVGGRWAASRREILRHFIVGAEEG